MDKEGLVSKQFEDLTPDSSCSCCWQLGLVACQGREAAGKGQTVVSQEQQQFNLRPLQTGKLYHTQGQQCGCASICKRKHHQFSYLSVKQSTSTSLISQVAKWLSVKHGKRSWELGSGKACRSMASGLRLNRKDNRCSAICASIGTHLNWRQAVGKHMTYIGM